MVFVQISRQIKLAENRRVYAVSNLHIGVNDVSINSICSKLILDSNHWYSFLKQDKAICQDEWTFAMGNRDKKIVEYKDLLKKAAAAAN